MKRNLTKNPHNGKKDGYIFLALFVVLCGAVLAAAWIWDNQAQNGGENPFRQPEKAQIPTKLLEKAQSGNAADLYAVGHFYRMQNDWQNAVIWYAKSAEKGYGKAYANLGVAYIEGWGVQRDVLKACQNFDLAYEKLQDAKSAANIALCYDEKDNPQRDTKKALQFYQIAAKQPNMAQEQRNLGLLYLDDKSGAKNAVLSPYWLREAVKNDDVRAMFWLARAYFYGDGVEKRRENTNAAYILLKAAQVKAKDEDLELFKKNNLDEWVKQGEKHFAISQKLKAFHLEMDLKNKSGREIIAKIDEIAPYQTPDVAKLTQEMVVKSPVASSSSQPK